MQILLLLAVESRCGEVKEWTPFAGTSLLSSFPAFIDRVGVWLGITHEYYLVWLTPRLKCDHLLFLFFSVSGIFC